MKNLLKLLLILALVTVMLPSCSHEDGKTVMVVGDNRVSYDEYRYFYMNFRDSHEAVGDTDYAAEMKGEIEDALRLKYAKINLAAEHKVTLDKEDLAAVDKMEQYYIDSYDSEELFASSLLENHLTRELFRSMLEAQGLDEILRDYLCNEYTGVIQSDDKTVEDYINAHFYHAAQIFIVNDPGEDIGKNKELARELQMRAAAGEDFNSLMLEYNEDPAMVGDTDGYYFVDGQLLKEFEDAAKALAVDEISDLVISDKGFHIIKRLELDPIYIDNNFEELRETYKAKMYNDLTEKAASEIEVRYMDYFDTLTDDMLVAGVEKAEG